MYAPHAFHAGKNKGIEVLKLLEMQQTDTLIFVRSRTHRQQYMSVYVIHIMFIHGKLYQEICQLCPIQLRDCLMDADKAIASFHCINAMRGNNHNLLCGNTERLSQSSKRLIELDSFCRYKGKGCISAIGINKS